mmetsp:Transcript_43987/g.76637  ORF Transcript_43987/g.76637 Transcript_43987/m.76637 type:complete len:201 (+) Transcript_43987:1721-2323(+)
MDSLSSLYLPVSISTTLSNISYTEAKTMFGDMTSSLKSKPVVVHKWSLVGAGTSLGLARSSCSCHCPGSNKAASSTSWILKVRRAFRRASLEKNLSNSGMRMYGAVRYCSISSQSFAPSVPSKSGSLAMCRMSSSVSTRSPSRILGLAWEGVARGSLPFMPMYFIRREITPRLCTVRCTWSSSTLATGWVASSVLLKPRI